MALFKKSSSFFGGLTVLPKPTYLFSWFPAPPPLQDKGYPVICTQRILHSYTLTELFKTCEDQKFPFMSAFHNPRTVEGRLTLPLIGTDVIIQPVLKCLFSSVPSSVATSYIWAGHGGKKTKIGLNLPITTPCDQTCPKTKRERTRCVLPMRRATHHLRLWRSPVLGWRGLLWPLPAFSQCGNLNLEVYTLYNVLTVFFW